MTDSEPNFPYAYAALSAAFVLVCVVLNYRYLEEIPVLSWVASLLLAISVLALAILAAKWFARRKK